jgi:hypothetical protein
LQKAVDEGKVIIDLARREKTLSKGDRNDLFQSTKRQCLPDAKFYGISIIEHMKKKGTALFMSPFEAEWQVVHMQRHKQIDVIYSTDSDCMLLGATEVIVDIGWGKEECLLFDFRNAAVECATEFKPYVDKLIEIGCFGGGASLVPLNDLPTGAEWSDLIGFCPFTELLPLRSPDFSLAASSNAGFRYSKDPNSINFGDPKFSDEESESLGIEKGRPLPIFARINFEKLPPLCCLHEDLLRHFINASRFGLSTQLVSTPDSKMDKKNQSSRIPCHQEQ